MHIFGALWIYSTLETLIIFVKQKNVLLAQAFNSMYQHSQGELAYVLYYSFRNITTRVYTADIYV